MGMTLEEYAAQNPTAEPERERRAIDEAVAGWRRITAERQAAAEQAAEAEEEEAQRLAWLAGEEQDAEDLKLSIAQQLEQGNAPEIILLSALKALGLATHDAAWQEEAIEKYNGIYKPAEGQQFVFDDNAAIAARRLADLQAKYHDKMRRRLEKCQKEYKRLAEALETASDAINALDREEEAQQAES